MNETYSSSRKWEGIPEAAIGSFPLGFLKGLFILLLSPADKQLSGSAVWRSAALCRKQRVSFWWPSPPCYHNQLLAAPFYQDFILWWKPFTLLPDAQATEAEQSGWEASVGIPSCWSPKSLLWPSLTHTHSEITLSGFNSAFLWTLLIFFPPPTNSTTI